MNGGVSTRNGAKRLVFRGPLSGFQGSYSYNDWGRMREVVEQLQEEEVLEWVPILTEERGQVPGFL